MLEESDGLGGSAIPSPFVHRISCFSVGGTLTTTSPLCHEALLTLARKLEAAASDEDRDRVEAAARRLLDALIDHLRAEQAAMAGLSRETSREIARGQKRMINDLLELAVDVHDEDLWRCDGLAQQLIAELTVQADDERRIGFAAAMP